MKTGTTSVFAKYMYPGTSTMHGIEYLLNEWNSEKYSIAIDSMSYGLRRENYY